MATAVTVQTVTVQSFKLPATLVASPADRATGQGALSPCRQGITSVNGWSNNGANLDFWREIFVPALSAGLWSDVHKLSFRMIPWNFITASGWVLCVWLHRETDSFSYQKPFIFTEIRSPTRINRAAGLSLALQPLLPCRQACRQACHGN